MARPRLLMRLHATRGLVALAVCGWALGGMALADGACAQGSQAVAPGAPTANAAGVPAAAPGVGAAADVIGVWIDHTGRGAIEIVPCGGRLCGYVFWVQDALNQKGQPLLDRKNPDPKRRGKPMCGTQVLVNLQKQEPARVGNVWGAGSIYNPEDGEIFDAEIKLTSANELSVLGYLGIKMFGESFVWKRAPAGLTRCGPARV